MASNEGDKVVGHMAGAAAPFLGIALSQPMAVVGMFVLISVPAVLLAIFQGLRATAGTWGPPLLVALAAGAIYACHRWFWVPLCESPRVPRLITGGIMLAIAVPLELNTGFGGVAIGRVTGMNPESALMDAGFPVTDGIREAVETFRRDAARPGLCAEAFRAGRMAAGTSGAVNWALECRLHIPLAEQVRACRMLDARKGNAVDYFNEDFCASVGVTVRNRPGANWQY